MKPKDPHAGLLIGGAATYVTVPNGVSRTSRRPCSPVRCRPATDRSAWSSRSS